MALGTPTLLRAAAASAATVTTASLTPTAGALLVVEYGARIVGVDGGAPTISSTPSLTWTQAYADIRNAGASATASRQRLACWTTTAASATAMTVTCGSTSANRSIVAVREVTGASATANVATATTGTGRPAPTLPTPPASTSLVLAAAAMTGTGAITPPPGYTETSNTLTGTDWNLEAAYSGAAPAATWQWPTNGNLGAIGGGIEIAAATESGEGGWTETLTPSDAVGAIGVAVETGFSEAATASDSVGTLLTPAETEVASPAGVWVAASASWKMPSGLDSKGVNSLTASGIAADTLKNAPAGAFTTTSKASKTAPVFASLPAFSVEAWVRPSEFGRVFRIGSTATVPPVVPPIGGRPTWLQPPHRPTTATDITLYIHGTTDPIELTRGDWTTYLLIVWPSTPILSTFNISGLRFKGVFEIGGALYPRGGGNKYRNNSGTKLEPPLAGYGGMLERSFAVDVPASMRTATGRPFWWCDGIEIDTCKGSGDAVGSQQSTWWGDMFKTGIAGNQTAGNVDRYSDAMILRSDIVHGTYFFSEWDGTPDGGQGAHSDVMQNEGLGLRGITLWKFHAMWHGQGFYLNGAGGASARKYLPRDGYVDASFTHIEPMPWTPTSTLFGGVPAGYRPFTSSDDDSVNPSTVTVGIVPGGQYYGHFLGEECYFQNTNSDPDCAGTATPVFGIASASSSTRSLNTTTKVLTLSNDTRCRDNSTHDYAYVGNTAGGKWNRPAGTFKNWVYTKPPVARMVAVSDRGLVRRVTSKADLLTYLNSGT